MARRKNQPIPDQSTSARITFVVEDAPNQPKGPRIVLKSVSGVVVDPQWSSSTPIESTQPGLLRGKNQSRYRKSVNPVGAMGIERHILANLRKELGRGVPLQCK